MVSEARQCLQQICQDKIQKQGPACQQLNLHCSLVHRLGEGCFNTTCSLPLTWLLWHCCNDRLRLCWQHLKPMGFSFQTNSESAVISIYSSSCTNITYRWVLTPFPTRSSTVYPFIICWSHNLLKFSCSIQLCWVLFVLTSRLCRFMGSFLWFVFVWLYCVLCYLW